MELHTGELYKMGIKLIKKTPSKSFIYFRMHASITLLNTLPPLKV